MTHASAPLIHLIEVDATLAEFLRQSLLGHGFRVQHLASPADFSAVMADQACERPAAVVMDMMRPEDAATGANAGIPVVVMSVRDDMVTHLAAYRAGASHYLVKPVDPVQLCGLLDVLTARMPLKPYRVLLVDDDLAHLTLHANVLRQAGLEVLAVSQPLETLAALSRFKPDVLVLNVCMPEASGPELVSMIRDQDRYINLPILFLSSEADMTQQLLVLNLGGDDFLVKPVCHDHLVVAVTARARRARQNTDTLQRLQITLYERARVQRALDQHALVSIANAGGRITSANQAFCMVSGYSLDELLGHDHNMLKSGLHPAAFYQDMWRTVKSGQIWRGEICNRRKDGGLYWVNATITPFIDSDGQVYQYVSIRTDVTAIKENQETLRIAKERLRRGQNFANIGSWELGLQTGQLYWSERIGPLFGYPEGELETTYENFMAAIHPDDRQHVTDAVNACIENKRPYAVEHRVVWPDGTVRWLLERGAVQLDDAGNAVQMLGVVQDIDDRKRAEIKLTERERLLREAQTLARIGNWSANMTTGELTWSDEIYDIFGLHPDSFTPDLDAFINAVHPEDRALVTASQRAATKTGKHDVVHRIVRPGGVVRHVHELARADTDAAGNLLTMAGTVQDVTERVLAEARLKETEQRFSFAVESAGDGIWDWDLPTGKMRLSGHYEQMLGYAKGELDMTADAWAKSVHPEDLAQAQALLQDYLGGLSTAFESELRLQCKNGSHKWVLCRGTLVARDAHGQPVRMIGIQSDISARKQADEKLRVFQRLFEASEQGVGVTDPAGHLIYSNSAHDSIHGYPHEKVIGTHFSHFFSEPTRAWALPEIMAALHAHGSWSGKLPVVWEDGTEVITLANFGVIADAQGAPQYLFNIMSDFTDELFRQQQLAQAKEAAERADQAKSNFLSNVSHELRTPMNAIIGFAQLLEHDSALGLEQKKDVGEILQAGHHLLGLINEVLNLARIESGHVDVSLGPVALAPLCEECRQLLRPLAAKRGISLHIKLPEKAVVVADRMLLKQVLINLLSNAVKYNRAGGEVQLTAQPDDNAYLCIAVIDSGNGIAAHRLKDLFQPFDRLGAEHSEIEGTGIGLTITQHLVELLGSTVSVESEMGVGSTFSFELPMDCTAPADVGALASPVMPQP